MPLRPPDFDVDPNEPFKHDELGRDGSIRALARLVENEPHAAVVSVNGSFGSGKSAFLRMLAAQRCAMLLRFEAKATDALRACRRRHRIP